MRRDSRLSRMLHVLIHMDRHMQRATSDVIARMLGTNAVVVRRTMAGLREQGYVRSVQGHGGGWELACDLSLITLLDVYDALGRPPLFAIGPSTERPDCLVQQAVDAELADVSREAEALFLARFQALSVAQLAEQFDARRDALATAPALAAGAGEAKSPGKPATAAPSRCD